MKRSARAPGFTLLELLLAVLITAIVAGSLAATLFVAFRARAHALEAVARTRAVDIASDVMAADLANALPQGSASNTLAGPFTGAPDSLDFYCTGPESKATVQGDSKHIQYALAADPAKPSVTNLVRYVTTNLLAPVQLDPVQERVCRGVDSFTLSYYDGANWNDTWDPTQHKTLPVAVQMTLVLSPATAGDEPIQTIRTIPISCGVVDTTQLSLPGGGL